jgi:hypothetical protein
MCCKDVQPSNSKNVSGLLGLVGLALDLVIPVGVSCSPITVKGAGGGTSWLVLIVSFTVLVCSDHPCTIAFTHRSVATRVTLVCSFPSSILGYFIDRINADLV